ncbi:autotransporter outer membrane beta-barrel domain-containing protein, partial [Ochrobactrum quorumnocens]
MAISQGIYKSKTIGWLCSATLVGGTQLYCGAAAAEPSIVYSGDIFSDGAPLPQAGATDWNWGAGQVTLTGGTLELHDGATAEGDWLSSRETGHGASVLVDGAGSRLSVNQRVTIEDQTGASLAVSNGGAVYVNCQCRTQSLGVGVDAHTIGAVTVAGQGSAIVSDSFFLIGDSGTGTLLIEDGGQITSTGVILGGHADGGSGRATIAGRGSAWNGVDGPQAPSYFVVGGTSGHGELNLYDSGALNGRQLNIANGDGSTGIVNIGGGESDAAKRAGSLNVLRITFNETNFTGQIGNGSDGVLNFNTTDGLTVGAIIVGKGTINQIAGTTILTGNSTDYHGAVNITGGILQFGNGGAGGNLTTDISTGIDDVKKGQLIFNRANDISFANVISGTGDVIQAGRGTTTFSGANRYSGGTEIRQGTLQQGAAGALSSASAYQVAQTGTLDLGGFSTNIASLSNQGNVNFAGTGGATLHVAGNYSGNGAITINSVLGGDTSKTDLLAVDGDTSGQTKLNVINQDGSGALTVNGIKVVDVGGNSNGSFALGNGYTTKDGQQAIVGGAFAYTLQQGGAQGGTQGVNDGNWYLVSHAPNSDTPDDPGIPNDPGTPPVDPTCQDTNSCPPPPSPRYSAGAPVYEGYVQNMMALNKLPSLQQRVGNRYFAGASLRGSEDGGRAEGASFDARGVWARVEGAHNRLEPSTSTARMKQDINTLEMQTGVDGQFYENDKGRLIAGITAQYGHAKGDVSSQHGDGTITTDAWSLGATATWYGNDGFYLDGQSQVTWFDNDLDSSTANQSLANGRKATGYAVSLETGKQIALGGNWSLTPQAQLSWSSISANSFR